jgi:glycine C-acetyltransferase
MDLFNKISNAQTPLGMHGYYSYGYFMFPRLEGDISNRMIFNGKEKIIWSLNNYLGLANHPEVRKTDAEAAAQYGLATPMGARMMSGNSVHHEKLESELSNFVKKEDTFLLNYGYQGIFSIIDSLLDRNDILVYDKEAHACIVDGARLHQGKRFSYIHNDIDSLELNLKRAQKIRGENSGVLVITEGVYGMAGDQGKIREIVDLKKKYDFRLMIDDAHGFGTMGPAGEGTGVHQGVQDEIDIYFSTFAKSMASIGAFVSGPKAIINQLRYTLRSQIFAKSLPMPLVIGNSKRLELIKKHPEFKEDLWKVVNKLQKGLKENNLNIGHTSSAITPVYLEGNIPEAANLVLDLRENHMIFCSLVVYPVIPKGQIMLRIVPSAIHTEEDIILTLQALTTVSDKLNKRLYNNEKVIF